MLLVMGVTLYTSRIILQSLGFKEYGLYNVIGGFVGLFSIITGSLSTAISRYITFELGTGNFLRLKKIFSSALFIQLLICLVIIILSLTIGIWFINNKMKIPEGYYGAAYWVFAFSIASFCLGLLSVPYNATLIAHEKMSTFSYVSIVEVVLKLGIAYSINLFHHDKIIYYALMIFLVSVIIQLIYMGYCWKHFDECRSKVRYHKSFFKEISKFAGWNFIGAASSVLRNQGNNILLNLFYGTIVNAAYAISMQVSNAVLQFSNNFMVAVNPQITKLYANGETMEMLRLINRSAKMSFFLCWIIAIIIMLNTNYILEIWLDNIPEYTSKLVQLVLFLILSESVSYPLITAMLANGNIRDYQLIVGGLQMLNLPLSYIALKLGYTPPCVLIIAIIISQCCLCARLIMLSKMIRLKIQTYLKDVYLRCLAVAALSSILPIVIKHYFPQESFFILILESGVCLVCSLVSIFVIGFNHSEREFVLKHLSSLKEKLVNHD